MSEMPLKGAPGSDDPAAMPHARPSGDARAASVHASSTRTPARVDAAGLRGRLRADLSQAHDRLDALFSQLDLGVEADYAHFLRAQEAGMRWMQARIDIMTPPEIASYLGQMIAALRADLAEQGLMPLDLPPVDLSADGAGRAANLTTRPVAQAPGETGSLGATAIDYVVMGSRLGTAVLRRIREAGLAARPDPAAPRPADHYFALPFDMGQWRAFCDATAALPAEGPRAERCLRDARACFDAFSEALTRSLQTDARQSQIKVS